jgi:hypothetical protein
LKVDFPKQETAPFTVLSGHARNELTRDRLRELADFWSRHDDVFCSEFLENIIFVASPYNTLSESAIRDTVPSDWGTKWFAVVREETGGHTIEPGPYMM